MAYCSLPGGATLPGTSAFTLTAPDTGNDYLIQVSVPDAPPPDYGYSVLYLLDGNARLPLMQAARDTLTRRGFDSEGNPLLIVAIGYPATEHFNQERRSADLTPPLSVSRVQPLERHPHGGADRFLRFIEESLKPEINRRFAVNTDQEAIMGHSYGGLFVLHTLLTQPASFERYIAISPSLWWYGDTPLDTLALRYPVLTDTPASTRVMIGVGEKEQPALDQGDTERTRRQRSRAMVDNARAFAEWLGAQPNALNVSLTIFPDENHGSVMWPATRQAIEFLK